MKISDPKTMGELMRARRRQLGFTIAQFAQATGISPITVMRLELGRVGYIHEKTAKALEVPKRLTKRMVMEPVAVMQDGTSVPLAPLSTMPRKGPSVAYGGDIEALPPVRRARPQATHGQAHIASPLKKALLWLAEKI